MYKIRKFLKYVGYSFVYVVISILSAYGFMLLSSNLQKNSSEIGAETPLPEQITSMVEHFSTAKVLDLDLSADINSAEDSYTINLDAIVDLSQGIEKVAAEGTITATINFAQPAVQTLALSNANQGQTIEIDFVYQNDLLYLDLFGGKMVMQTSSMAQTITELLAIFEIDIASTGVTDILNMPIKDMLAMLSNIKEEEKLEDKINMVIALPMVGDALLTCDTTYKLQGLSSDMVISEDMTVGLDTTIGYPENVQITEKNSDEYVNIGNLLQVAKPLAEYIKNPQLAFSFNVIKEGAQVGQNSTLGQGKVFVDTTAQTAKIELSAYGEKANIFFIDNELFVEFKNIYAKFALVDIEQVSAMLENSFGIVLPTEIVDNVVAFAKGQPITLPNGMDLTNLDFNSIDLSMIEKVEVKANSTFVTLRDIGIIRITTDGTEDSLLESIAFSGFGYQAELKTTKYSEYNLKTEIENYVDLVAFIPTLENVVEIFNHNLISAEVAIDALGTQFLVNVNYDQAQQYALATTNIYGFDITVEYYNSFVYVNVANKFKCITNTTTFIDDILSFMKEIGVEVDIEQTEVALGVVLGLLDPAKTPLFITSFTETEKGFDITVFNGLTISLENETGIIEIGSNFEKVSVSAVISSNDISLTVPTFNNEDYTDSNILLNIASKLYNAGILDIAQPAFNSLKDGLIGLNLSVEYDGMTGNANCFLDISNKSFALTSLINNTNLTLIFKNNVFFLEYGNIYLTFGIEDYEEVESLLNDSFGIQIPDEFKSILGIILTGNISADFINSIDVQFNLNNFDISILDSLKVENGLAQFAYLDHSVAIGFNEQALTSISYNGLANINGTFIDFQDVTLSTDENNFIDISAFIPTIQNAVQIAQMNLIHATITADVEDYELIAFVDFDQNQNYAHAQTNIYGFDLSIDFYNSFVYVNVANKFKCITNTTTFADDLNAFLNSVGVQIPDNFDNEIVQILGIISTILNASDTPLLITNFVQTENGFTASTYNNITVSVESNSSSAVIDADYNNISLNIVISSENSSLTIPTFNNEDYTDSNILLNIASKLYNAGILDIAQPAFNSLKDGLIGLNLSVEYDGTTGNADCFLDISNKSFALTSLINNTNLTLIFKDNVFFLEYGNIYLTFKVEDLDKVEALLANNFGIVIPEEIKTVLGIILSGNITVDFINSLDVQFNLNNFDLTILDSLKVENGKATFAYLDHSIALEFNQDKLTNLSYNGLASVNADFIDFTQISLSTDKANYIDITAFIPTIENALQIAEMNLIHATITADVEDYELIAFVDFDQAEQYALATTNIYGFDITVEYYNSFVYVNVANKFKCITNTTTFVADFTAFLNEVDIEIPNNFDNEIVQVLGIISTILNASDTPLLITNFVQTENGFTATTFNNITLSVESNSTSAEVNVNYNDISLNIVISSENSSLTVPTFNNEDYTDSNVLLNIASKLYNAGILDIAQPAFNSLKDGLIGLNFSVEYDGMTGNANCFLDISNKSFALTSLINNTNLTLIFKNNVFFLEYGNIYLTFNLEDYDEVVAMLDGSFGIVIPQEVKTIIGIITTGKITADMINDYDISINLNDFDMTILDGLTIANNVASFTYQGHTISIGFDENKLTTLAYNGLASVNGTFIEYQNTTLATDEENYIALVSFIPTIENAVEISKLNLIEATISLEMEETEYVIAVAYAQDKQYAHLQTTVVGLDINLDYINSKVYINVADKFKFVTDSTTAVNDILEFITELGFEPKENYDSEIEEVLALIAEILNPASNSLLIKTFVENEEGFTLTTFNDIIVSVASTETSAQIDINVDGIKATIIINGSENTLEVPEINAEDYTNTNVMLGHILTIHRVGLTGLITPATNTFTSPTLGLALDIKYDEYQITGNVSVDMVEMIAQVDLDIRGVPVKVTILQDNVAYIEFGNVFIKFDINNLTDVEDTINSFFAIDLPLEEIVEVANKLRLGTLTIKEVIDLLNIDIDWEKIDLSFLEKLTIENGVYTLPIEHVGTFSISEENDILSSVGYNGYGIDATVGIGYYNAPALTMSKEEYIDAAKLIPTLNNVLEIAEQNTLYGTIEIDDPELGLTVPITYSIAKDDEIYLTMNTSIYGADVSLQLYKGKIYIDFAGNVKLSLAPSDLPNIIKDLFASAGKNLPLGDNLGLVENLFNILLTGDTTTLVDDMVELYDAVKSSILPSTNAKLIKSLIENEEKTGFTLTLFNDMAINLNNGFASKVNKTPSVEVDTVIDNVGLDLSLFGTQEYYNVPELETDGYQPIENVLELAKAFLNMTHKDDFAIKGTVNVGINLGGENDVYTLTIPVDAKVKMVDGEVMFQAVLGKFPRIPVVNNDVPWKVGDIDIIGDDRIVYIYGYKNDIYIYRHETVAAIGGARSYEKKTKVTMDAFLGDIMYYLQYMIGFSDTIMAEIEKAMALASNRTEPINLNNVINSLSADGDNFTVVLNLAELANNPQLGLTSVGIGLKRDSEDKSYIATLGLAVNMPFSASLQMNLTTQDFGIVNYGQPVDMSGLENYVSSYTYGYGQEYSASKGNWGLDSEKQYTLRFEENGGNEVADITAVYNAGITLPSPGTFVIDDETAKTTYTFDGWWATSNFQEGTQFISSTMPKRDYTLYAKWIASPIYYRTINFVSASGHSVNSIKLLAGATLPTLPTINENWIVDDGITKNTKTFAGWYLDEEFTTPFNATSMPDQNTTVYAKWNDNIEYYRTISFVSASGHSVESITLLEGETLPTLPTINENWIVDDGITKNTKTFAGWYLDEEFTTQFSETSMPTADTTLYAKWNDSIEYYRTISFVTYDENTTLASITKLVGQPIEINPLISKVETVDGLEYIYNFDAWYVDEQFTTKFESAFMPTEDTTLYAKWILAVKPVSLTVYHNDLETPVYTALLEEGNSFSLANIGVLPADALYYTDKAFENQYTEFVATEDLVLYARIKYTVTVTNEFGQTVQYTDYQGKTIDYITPATPDIYDDGIVRITYSFGGYSEAISTIPTQNTTISVVWNSVVETYRTINFITNNPSYSFDSITMIIGKELPTLPTITEAWIEDDGEICKITRTFAGWFVDEACTNAFTSTVMPENNTTLYAKWNVETVYYRTITYVTGWTSYKINPLTELAGTAIELDYITRNWVTDDGITKVTKVFDGWFTTDTFEAGSEFDVTIMPDQDITIYAKWNATTEYYRTVTYVSNHEAYSPASVTKLEGKSLELPTYDVWVDKDDPTSSMEKITRTFLGWYTTADFQEGTQFTANTIPTQNVTLYGKWQRDVKKYYTISFNTTWVKPSPWVDKNSAFSGKITCKSAATSISPVVILEEESFNSDAYISYATYDYQAVWITATYNFKTLGWNTTGCQSVTDGASNYSYDSVGTFTVTGNVTLYAIWGKA